MAHTFGFECRPDRPGVEDEGGGRGRVPEARGGLVVVLAASVEEPAQHERESRRLPHLEHRRARRRGRGARATSGAQLQVAEVSVGHSLPSTTVCAVKQWKCCSVRRV